MSASSHRPNSTYRLQFGPGLTFADATGLVDYLAELGVGALYASPLLTASAGSTHGYDVVDPTRTSEVLGGDAGRRALAARLHEAGLGFLLDIVPNHMGVAEPAANPWWWDVLRLGAESGYAHFFDIDFAAGPILLPVLADDGDGGRAALAELRVDADGLHYAEHHYPLAPGTEGGTAEQVHQRQHYRLVSWRRGAAELTYRRFFDVCTLAAVRVEEPTVFAETHGEILNWLRAGEITGLRVDHPDGLTDPGGYLRRLRDAAGSHWLVVEKILGVGEALPQSWPADGSTGYDALRQICGVFVDPAGEPTITALATQLCGPQDLAEIEQETKQLVCDTILRSEVLRIARLLDGIPADDAETAVATLLGSFPVYRSYLPEGGHTMRAALDTARDRQPRLAGVFDRIGAALADEPTGELAVRVQQTSSMVMAKGVEDTAFYRYNRFVALNEVGGDPGRFGVSTAELHAAAAIRESGWPATMTTLSTHDTKRSEDVRARLAVLAELPEEFAARVQRWSAHAALPEPTLNLLAWQTLVGAWPIEVDRLRDYLHKASKEAKVRTTWNEPDEEFDQAVRDWAQRVLGNPELSAEIAAFAELITPAGWSNSLGQKLLQLAGPGVPDVYQGTELWDFSLVDPDNRRPVDFEARRALLARLDAGWMPEVDSSGAAKLLVTSRLLRLRRDRPECFRGYRPVRAEGPAAGHLVAFERGPASELIAVATRFPVTLAARGGWADTMLPLPDGHPAWTEVFSGRRVAGPVIGVSDLLARYPVALLVRS